MSQKGFSLIECMIYCMMTAILFTTWFHGIVLSYTSFTQVSNRITQLSNFYAAHDFLVRDIRQAPTVRTQWKKISASEVIWQGQDIDVGWKVIDNKLVRIQGFYDTQKRIWHKKKTGVAALEVDRILFINQGNSQNINKLVFEITMKNKHMVKTSVKICNGVING